MELGEFKLGFMDLTVPYSAVFTVRHVGPCRICRLGSDIFLVVYIYICIYVYMCGCAANLVLQVAVVWFCVCFVFLSCCGFFVENELNLLSPTTST